MKQYDVIIVGAGASGLVCACQTMMNNPNLHILVIEKESVAGRKLSAAGNGKGNLTNLAFERKYFVSDTADILDAWYENHSSEEIMQFFQNLGIILYEKNGYVYPLSNQGKQVTKHLVTKCMDLGVSFLYETTVTSVVKQKELYLVDAQNVDGALCHYSCQNIVLATGGIASPKLGGCNIGYEIAKQFELSNVATYPCLCPVYVNDQNLKAAKGVRLDGIVSLRANGTVVYSEQGQIQFNDDNLSGIVIMNLSGLLNKDKSLYQEDFSIDLIPQYDWNQLYSFFNEQLTNYPSETIYDMLCGLMPANFVNYILKRLRIINEERLSNISQKQWNRLTSTIKKLTFHPVYRESYEKAQVTGGGVSLQEIDVHTFESKVYRNMYLTGELLDVYGWCGGYNLSFAILSGIAVANKIGVCDD